MAGPNRKNNFEYRSLTSLSEYKGLAEGYDVDSLINILKQQQEEISKLKFNLGFTRRQLEREVDELTEAREGHARNVEQLHRQVAELIAELNQIRASFSYRAASPIRGLVAIFSKLRRYLGVPLTQVPLHQVKLLSADHLTSTWEFTGPDPNFRLIWPTTLPLSPGHYRLSFTMFADFDPLAQPKLYVDTGLGYHEGEAWTAAPGSKAQDAYCAAISLTKVTHSIRFDPCETLGRSVLGNFHLRRLSRIEYYSRVCVQVATAAAAAEGSPLPLLARLFKTILHYGPREAAALLREGALSVVQAPKNERVLKDDKAVYVPLQGAAPDQVPVKLICFYLPQFHTIPENDEWWGEGFTEWTNVRPAQPQFRGHYQPHIPDLLGYYDLSDSDVQRKQIDIAKTYGIGGFCFYYYWFNGKIVLDAPTLAYLNDETLDLPFCLCWANENWSRRWDGRESEVLISQKHSAADDIAFIKNMEKFLRDPRYIRIDGKPLLIVYRPGLLPSMLDTSRRWRKWCRENGIGEIFLAYTQSFERDNPSIFGFDAAIEFPPNNSAPPDITPTVEPLVEDFQTKVYDWEIFLERSRTYEDPGYVLFRSVCPGWDNTARRKNRGTVFGNSSPERFGEWLGNAIEDTKKRLAGPDQRLVFVNAWNEWAEGAHLEPDQRYGFAYLEAARKSLISHSRSVNPSVLLVTHDCHPHGAQFLILAVGKELRSLGYEVSVVTLGGGPLLSEFLSLGPLIDASATTAADVAGFLDAQRRRGTRDVITNTVVSGSMLPQLKALGFAVMSLIHEMPGVIRSMKQEANAKLVSEYSDHIVFASNHGRKLFEEIAPLDDQRVLIRPQGVLRKNPYKGRHDDAHSFVCAKHGLPPNTKLVVAVGFLDHRKGADIFVEVAEQALKRNPNLAFLWVGHVDPDFEVIVRREIEARGLTDRVILVGFDRSPMAYYAAASVYALTSREDPFPNVVLESAEVGVPVVGFKDASGAADFILDQGGFLVEQFDTAAFAEAVLKLLEKRPVKRASSTGSLRRYVMDLLHRLNGFKRISVVVPNYNYEFHLTQRLNSILQQTLPVYEIIFLDDASSDRSVETATAVFQAEHASIDYQVIVNKTNSGSVFRQWQKGVGLCTGDLVWIAEADDYADPAFLEVVSQPFSDPGTCLSYSQSKQIDEKGIVLAENYLAYTGDISDAWESDYLRRGIEEVREALSIKNTIPNVSAVLFKRQSLVTALGELKSELEKYRVGGDWRIYIHVLSSGNVAFSRRALNFHRRHTSSVTKSRNSREHLQEILSLQQTALDLTKADVEQRAKARNYAAWVAKYLGVDESVSDELVKAPE